MIEETNRSEYELWCEILAHLRNGDILLLRGINLSAHRATRTMPLMFNYDLKGTGDDSSHIRFMVAPVTDEEE